MVLKQEDTLDLYEDRLDTYLVYLSAQALSQQDSRRVGKMQHAIGDFERLGDHAVNLVKAGRSWDQIAVFLGGGPAGSWGAFRCGAGDFAVDNRLLYQYRP